MLLKLYPGCTLISCKSSIDINSIVFSNQDVINNCSSNFSSDLNIACFKNILTNLNKYLFEKNLFKISSKYIL